MTSKGQVVQRRESSGQMKVALQAKSEEELLALQAIAQSLNLQRKGSMMLGELK